MTLGIGLVGSGGMGLTWAEVVVRHATDARLAAIWGGSRASGLAARYGVPAESSLTALLARRDVDAVVVASPLATHAGYVVAAAAAGKHVFLEKPMCGTLDEADRMIRACAEADVRLAVITQHRFRRTPVAAKRLIAEGAIGEVRMIHARGMLSWPDLGPGHVPWAELGYHVCDLLRWFAGSEIVDASARFTSFAPEPEPARTAMALFRFANGVLGSVWLSYEVPPPGLGSQMQYQIVGSRGIIDLDSYAAVRLGTHAGWRIVDEQPAGDPADPLDQVRLDTYIPQFRDFEAAVRERRRPAVDGEDARKTVQMLLAALASGTRDAITPDALPSDGSLR